MTSITIRRKLRINPKGLCCCFFFPPPIMMRNNIINSSSTAAAAALLCSLLVCLPILQCWWQCQLYQTQKNEKRIFSKKDGRYSHPDRYKLKLRASAASTFSKYYLFVWELLTMKTQHRCSDLKGIFLYHRTSQNNSISNILNSTFVRQHEHVKTSHEHV